MCIPNIFEYSSLQQQNKVKVKSGLMMLFSNFAIAMMMMIMMLMITTTVVVNAKTDCQEGGGGTVCYIEDGSGSCPDAGDATSTIGEMTYCVTGSDNSINYGNTAVSICGTNVDDIQGCDGSPPQQETTTDGTENLGDITTGDNVDNGGSGGVSSKISFLSVVSFAAATSIALV